MKERSNINGSFDNPGNPRASLKSDDRTFSRILQGIVNHLTEIIRSELRLAQTELRRDLTQVVRASVFIVVGALAALYALGFILLAAVYGLATVMDPWLSAVIVGVAVAIVAVIFLQIGRSRLKRASLKPDETIQSLRENITWMKKQTE